MKLLQVATACALSLFVGHAAIAAEAPIKIGFPIPLTGEIPKVGEGSKYAAEMLKEEINAKGGLQVGDKKYPLDFMNPNPNQPSTSPLSSLSVTRCWPLWARSPPGRPCPPAAWPTTRKCP